MAEEKDIDQTTEQAEPHGEVKTEDWQAKYEALETKYNDLKANSRKWEGYAKANKAEAEKNRGAVTELESIRAEVESLKADNAQKAAENTRLRIHDETGVPLNLIKGDDEEAMRQTAQAIAEYVKTAKPYPEDKGGAGGAHKMSKADIEAIKDPMAQLRAIRENPDLF